MAITQAGSTLQITVTSNANTGTVSSAITVPADAEAVVVAISAYGRADTAGHMSGGSVTFTKGATQVAMTSVGGSGDAGTTWMGAMWYLALPDTGTNKTLNWDWLGTSTSDDNLKNWTLTFWKGVDTASLARDGDSIQAGALPVTTPTLTAQSGDLIVAFCASFNSVQDGSGTVDTWTNLTELTEITHVNYAEGCWATGSPSGNTTVAAATGTNWEEPALMAVVLKPAATAKTLPADAGSYTVTGTAASLERGYRLFAEPAGS